MDFTTTFSMIEWLAITGLVQSVLILVYIAFRARNWRQAAVAFSYFLFLAFSFGLQFALRLEDFAQPIRLVLWFTRAMGAPLCYLLVIQVVQLTDFPGRRHFWTLVAAPTALGLALLLARLHGLCDAGGWRCERFFETLYWIGAMASALCLLSLWAQIDIFGKLWRVRGPRDRYWLIMALIAANIFSAFSSLLYSLGKFSQQDSDALQVTFGIAFAYIATTTLFRIYPLPVQMSMTSRARTLLLSEQEKKIAAQVQKLMELDKIYHEATFSRADLAREVGCSENTLSKVINRAFGKSFPQLMNGLRVEDAKRLLQVPDIPINVLYREVGFNSLASFNRVFRDITGETPSEYRAGHILKEEEAGKAAEGN